MPRWTDDGAADADIDDANPILRAVVGVVLLAILGLAAASHFGW